MLSAINFSALYAGIITDTSALFILNYIPVLRNEIVNTEVYFFGIEPVIGRKGFTPVAGKPCAPPAKTAVGNNMVFTGCHQRHIFPTVFTDVVLNIVYLHTGQDKILLY